MRADGNDWKPFLAVLEGLTFIEKARVEAGPRVGGPPAADGRLIVRAGGRDHAFWVDRKRGPRLARPVAEAFISRAGASGEPWILFAEAISVELAESLRRADANFVDRAGNHHVRIGRSFQSSAAGLRLPRQARRGRALGVPGYRLLFALMARPDLLDAPPIRRIASEAGVGKSTVAESLQRLFEEGVIARGRTGWVFVRPTRALDRWLHGYAELLRPKLVAGRFEYEGDWRDLMKRWRIAFAAEREGTPAVAMPRWAWGGGFAARQLTQHLEAPLDLIHVERDPAHFVERARLAPSGRGRLALHVAPGPVAFERAPAAGECAHPLLVYTELMTTGDERAREAAQIIRARHLTWLGS